MPQVSEYGGALFTLDKNLTLRAYLRKWTDRPSATGPDRDTWSVAIEAYFIYHEISRCCFDLYGPFDWIPTMGDIRQAVRAYLMTQYMDDLLAYRNKLERTLTTLYAYTPADFDSVDTTFKELNPVLTPRSYP